jgi:hypothetical protein
MKKVIYLFVWLFICQSIDGQIKNNILEDNIKLLKSLSVFYSVYKIDSLYIKFQTEEISNFGFGVAFKKNGKIIYPAEKNTSYNITSKNGYIIMSKGDENFYNTKYGMIDPNGNIVLDFKYDRIENVFVPLPDTLISVQMGNKFGVFNTNSKKISDIKYDNSGNWLNDGYSYHEGGAGDAQQAIYSQLGIKNFAEKHTSVKDYSDEVIINKDKEDEQYLISKNGRIISKKYLYINQVSYYEPLYFIGTTDPYNCELINQTGKIIDKIECGTVDHDDYYIKLNKIKYYFVKTDSVITIPENFRIFVDCYSDNGFLGFINNNDDNIKLFIDVYGNEIFINKKGDVRPVK